LSLLQEENKEDEMMKSQKEDEEKEELIWSKIWLKYHQQIIGEILLK